MHHDHIKDGYRVSIAPHLNVSELYISAGVLSFITGTIGISELDLYIADIQLWYLTMACRPPADYDMLSVRASRQIL